MKRQWTLSRTARLCILVILIAGVGILSLQAAMWATPSNVAFGQTVSPPPDDDDDDGGGGKDHPIITSPENFVRAYWDEEAGVLVFVYLDGVQVIVRPGGVTLMWNDTASLDTKPINQLRPEDIDALEVPDTVRRALKDTQQRLIAQIIGEAISTDEEIEQIPPMSEVMPPSTEP
jgi:hypothetical protein